MNKLDSFKRQKMKLGDELEGEMELQQKTKRAEYFGGEARKVNKMDGTGWKRETWGQ